MSQMIQALPATHEESLESPVAVLVPGDEDTLHLVLLVPGGQGWEAIGSYSEVRTRGMSPRRLPRAQLQSALQRMRPVVAGPPKVITIPTIPLYRLYNARTSDHFYTTSAPERDKAKA